MPKSFRSLIVSCIAMAATVSVAGSLNASLITYGDFNSWSSQVTGVASEEISEPAYPSTTQYFGKGDQSIEFGNATFSQAESFGDAAFAVIGIGFSGVPAFVTSQLETTGVANIQIDFNYELNGFALNFGTEKAGSTVTFQLFNSGTSIDTFTKVATGGNAFNTANFVGATDSPFTTILITTTDPYLNVNHLFDASPSNADVVPEPSTLAMFSLGGIGLTLCARRRRIAKS